MVGGAGAGACEGVPGHADGRAFGGPAAFFDFLGIEGGIAGRPVIWGFGAHVIKTGVSPVLRRSSASPSVPRPECIVMAEALPKE